MLLIMFAATLVLQEVRVRGPVNYETTTSVLPQQKCAPSTDDELVVCARADGEQFRLRPLPPPPNDADLLTRPLRVQIAPGVSLGFQHGGGFGLKAKFGGTEKAEHSK
jgi:hypothetical protein